MGFALRTLVTALSLWAADYFLAGITFEPIAYTADAQLNYAIALALGAVTLGVLNAIVRPVLFMLSLPITCLTLGLFILILNGVILVLLSLIPFVGFRVDGLLSAVIGALVVSVVSFLLQRVIPTEPRSRRRLPSEWRTPSSS